MIRLALSTDIPQIAAGYSALFDYEDKNGSLTNWKRGVYPVKETAEKALAEHSMFVLETDGKICASMILNSDQADCYRDVEWKWRAQENEVLVIHTLCVVPGCAKKGLGTQMVKFAESYAQENGFKVIRFDTWKGNKAAFSLYTKLGYRYAGSLHVMHMGVIDEEQIFFEAEIG